MRAKLYRYNNVSTKGAQENNERINKNNEPIE